jgi:hypothetical protein
LEGSLAIYNNKLPKAVYCGHYGFGCESHNAELMNPQMMMMMMVMVISTITIWAYAVLGSAARCRCTDLDTVQKVS